MTEIRQVLEKIPQQQVADELNWKKPESGREVANLVEIPEIFFDKILGEFTLTRVDVQVLLYFYRQVWCHPNLYKKYGISNINNLADVAKILGVSYQDLHKSLKKLESFEFITTIRLGQYFVRRFFIPELDEFYGHLYDDFMG